MQQAGRSDYPNLISNVLSFPGVFRGVFDVQASNINGKMTLTAAMALLELVPDEELNENNIMSAPFDPRVGSTVAKAVAESAKATGVSNRLFRVLLMYRHLLCRPCQKRRGTWLERREDSC